MKKTLNRKEFLTLGVSASAFLVGCADGDEPMDGTTGGQGSGGAMGSGGGMAMGSGGDSAMASGSGGDSTMASGSGGDSTMASGSGGDSTMGSGGDAMGSGGDAMGSGGDDGSGGEMGMSCAMVASEIGTNHGHGFAMEVSAGDVAAAMEKTYDIQGTAMHPHMLTVTAQDFATLASDGMVVVASSTDNGHSHDVTLTCSMA